MIWYKNRPISLWRNLDGKSKFLTERGKNIAMSFGKKNSIPGDGGNFYTMKNKGLHNLVKNKKIPTTLCAKVACIQETIQFCVRSTLHSVDIPPWAV